MIQNFNSIFYNVVENYENIYSNEQNLETKGEKSTDISVKRRDNTLQCGEVRADPIRPYGMVGT